MNHLFSDRGIGAAIGAASARAPKPISDVQVRMAQIAGAIEDLADTLQVLRGRLEHVLIPAGPVGDESNASTGKLSSPFVDSLVDRLHGIHRATAIARDIQSRLTL